MVHFPMPHTGSSEHFAKYSPVSGGYSPHVFNIPSEICLLKVDRKCTYQKTNFYFVVAVVNLVENSFFGTDK